MDRSRSGSTRSTALGPLAVRDRGNLLLSLRVAVPVSAALVAFSVVTMTSPPTGRHWASGLVGAVALFLAIVYTGASIDDRRHR